MSAYSHEARPGSYMGSTFDSQLEIRWARTIERIGLTWRREPFALLRNPGMVTTRNVIARPDLWIPELALIVECKPTLSHVTRSAGRWMEEASDLGRPIAVTAGYPQAELVRAGTVGYQDPPRLLVFTPDRRTLSGWFAACPDCDAVGLLAVDEGASLLITNAGIQVMWALGAALEVDYVGGDLDDPNPPSMAEVWMSACRHAPKWQGAFEITRAIRDDRIYGRLLNAPSRIGAYK